MSYYYSKTLLTRDFTRAINQVTDELKKEGFGVLTDIDIKATFKKKLDVDFKEYRILGACNPTFAHNALTNEDKIGLYLPCNVVVETQDDNSIEVSIIDPVKLMGSVDNPALQPFAEDIKAKLIRMLESLK